jgi:hypothetical protein
VTFLSPFGAALQTQRLRLRLLRHLLWDSRSLRTAFKGWHLMTTVNHVDTLTPMATTTTAEYLPMNEATATAAPAPAARCGPRQMRQRRRRQAEQQGAAVVTDDPNHRRRDRRHGRGRGPPGNVPPKNVYTPPDAHYTEARVPEDLVAHMGMVIGRDGSVFKAITSASRCKYLWYDASRSAVEVWGPEACLSDALQRLTDRFEACRERILAKAGGKPSASRVEVPVSDPSVANQGDSAFPAASEDVGSADSIPIGAGDEQV